MWKVLWTTALVVLATARLTRFITEDTLGHWLIVRRARLWAVPRSSMGGWTEGDGTTPARPEVVIDHAWEGLDPNYEGWKVKLVSGLDCRWCVGFWLGVAVLLTHRIPGVKWVLTALALNSVANYVGEKIGTLPD